MFVSIDLCLVPIGVGTSLSPYIKECIEVIKNEGLNYELGANGTAIEGDWDKECREHPTNQNCLIYCD